MTLTLLKYIIIDKTIDVTFHQLMDNLILPDFKSSGHNVCQLTLNDVYGFMNEMFTNQLILQKKKVPKCNQMLTVEKKNLYL